MKKPKLSILKPGSKDHAPKGRATEFSGHYPYRHHGDLIGIAIDGNGNVAKTSHLVRFHKPNRWRRKKRRKDERRHAKKST